MKYQINMCIDTHIIKNKYILQKQKNYNEINSQNHFFIQIMRGESVQICKSFGSKFQALFSLLEKVDCSGALLRHATVPPCGGPDRSANLLRAFENFLNGEC